MFNISITARIIKSTTFFHFLNFLYFNTYEYILGFCESIWIIYEKTTYFNYFECVRIISINIHIYRRIRDGWFWYEGWEKEYLNFISLMISQWFTRAEHLMTIFPVYRQTPVLLPLSRTSQSRVVPAKHAQVYKWRNNGMTQHQKTTKAICLSQQRHIFPIWIEIDKYEMTGKSQKIK